MKKIVFIKSLTLTNFKGIKSLHIDFENQTDIYGANGTGKTTIADAFNWLWFGKDSNDRKDFEIKTLDIFGKVIPMIEHEVSAVYQIDGETVTMKRILKENWVKKRGSLESEFSGNVTDLYWNEVPLNLSEFNKKVNLILDEQVFKMITSPTYFNSCIEWKTRRNLLTQIAGGEISDNDIASGNSEYEALIANLTQGKTLEDYKAQILASVKKAKEDLKAIPTRIDEVSRTKPEALDFDALEKELQSKGIDLAKVNEDIADINKAFESKLESQKDDKLKINDVKVALGTIEANAKRAAQDKLAPKPSAVDGLVKSKEELEAKLYSCESNLKTLTDKKTSLEQEAKSVEVKMGSLRTEWENENAKELTFNDNDFHCPTCKREFETGDVESKKAEMLNTFKANKKNKLDEINRRGAALKQEKENAEKEAQTLIPRIKSAETLVDETKEEIEKLKAQISSEKEKDSTPVAEQNTFEVVYQSILDSDNQYQENLLLLETLQGSLVEVPGVDNSELVNKRNILEHEINIIKGKLLTKNQIEAVDNRIQQLRDEEKTLGKQILEVEKIQFTIESFIKAKIDRLEAAINEKFNLVNFKMFEEQINGGMRETCVAMVNGVPFSDLNTASKMNAGLDIINTLCEFYKISAPIFIDNAESVHTLIDTDSQLIRLVVSELHKQLEIKSKELVA